MQRSANGESIERKLKISEEVREGKKGKDEGGSGRGRENTNHDGATRGPAEAVTELGKKICFVYMNIPTGNKVLSCVTY